MIKFISIIALFLGFNSRANVAFEIQGRLEKNSNRPYQLLITEIGNLEITTFLKDIYGCIKGNFLVVDNYTPQGTYSIIKSISCEEFER